MGLRWIPQRSSKIGIVRIINFLYPVKYSIFLPRERIELDMLDLASICNEVTIPLAP